MGDSGRLVADVLLGAGRRMLADEPPRPNRPSKRPTSFENPSMSPRRPSCSMCPAAAVAIALPWPSLGYDMTGVDISTDFLTAARAQSAGQPGKIDWEQREMRDLPWPEGFDGAYCFGNSFGYLDDDGKRRSS